MPQLNPDDFQRLTTLFVPETVSALAISPEGRYLAIAAGDKVHIHQFPGAATDARATFVESDLPRLVTLHLPEKITALMFSPNGRILTAATADKVHLFSVPAPAA